MLILFGLQGYQWLKDKVQSEEGKKQQAKVMDLLPIAHQLGCTVAQLAIGEALPILDPAGASSPPEKLPNPTGLSLGRMLFLRDASEVHMLTTIHQFSCFPPLAPAWCLRSEGVSSVLLGVSSAEQLIEHLGALQVSWRIRGRAHLCPLPRSQGLIVQPRMGL